MPCIAPIFRREWKGWNLDGPIAPLTQAIVVGDVV